MATTFKSISVPQVKFDPFTGEIAFGQRPIGRPRDRISASEIKSFLKASGSNSGERWITINSDNEGGGTHVKINGDGKIVAGPAGLAARGITHLSDFGKGKEDKESGSDVDPEEQKRKIIQRTEERRSVSRRESMNQARDRSRANEKPIELSGRLSETDQRAVYNAAVGRRSAEAQQDAATRHDIQHFRDLSDEEKTANESISRQFFNDVYRKHGDKYGTAGDLHPDDAAKFGVNQKKPEAQKETPTQKPVATSPAERPWTPQMSADAKKPKEMYLDEKRNELGFEPTAAEARKLDEDAERRHKKNVDEAFSRGEISPTSKIGQQHFEDYPDLGAKYGEKKPNDSVDNDPNTASIMTGSSSEPDKGA